MSDKWYKCPNCGTDLLWATNSCPQCNHHLTWSGQGPLLSDCCQPEIDTSKLFKLNKRGGSNKAYKVVSSIFYVIAIIFLINNLIAMFFTWNEYLGIGGILISIFLIPFAFIAYPFIAAAHNHSIVYFIGDAVLIGLMLGFFFLGNYFNKKIKAGDALE